MIEAIPASSDSIVLIITKVEDPEELDTRFSKFTPFGEPESVHESPFSKLEGAEDFLNLLNKVKEAAGAGTKVIEEKKSPEVIPAKLFSFEDIDRVIQASRLISPMYSGRNTLYHDAANEFYILALTQSEHTNNEFNKVCNMLSEYGTMEKVSGSVLAFLEEHCNTIISTNAVEKLAEV